MFDLPLKSGSFRRLFRVDDVTKHNTVKIYFFPNKKNKNLNFFFTRQRKKKKETDASVQMSTLPTADLDWNGDPGSKPPFIDSRARAGPKNLDVKMHQLDDKVTLSDLSSNFNFLLGSCETIFYLFLPDTL